MYRKAQEQLLQWKMRAGRKPLVLLGARQVGKTWLMKDFARSAYRNSVYVNFEDEEVLQGLFDSDFDIQRIITSLELRFNTNIDDETLLIFDEIQSARRGITSLKYFQEKAPHLHIIAADSLLGLTTSDSIPVGKVDYLRIYPMTFIEFLKAMGKDREAEVIERREWKLMEVVRDQLVLLLKTYYYVGGMPEAVQCFADNKDYNEVRRIQNDIITSYDSNFIKHAPAEIIPRIRMVWNSIPSQLAKENKKFIYGVVKSGGRAREFELALQWLIDAGQIIKVPRCKSGQLPLKAFEDLSAFKVFLLDVGLLNAMNRTQPSTIVDGNEMFLTFKGALTEQYVAQQLVTCVDQLYYWSAETSSGEIDFLVQMADKVIPIEVKAEENLHAKSLRAFVERMPGLHGLRLSMSNYRVQSWMTNVPLYALSGSLLENWSGASLRQ